MDEIELVVKIPTEEYEMIVNSEDCGLHTLTRAVARGAILPKGHGRLTDMDEAIKCLEEVTDSKEKQYALCLIDWACSKRVLIEADKEEYESD